MVTTTTKPITYAIAAAPGGVDHRIHLTINMHNSAGTASCNTTIAVTRALGHLTDTANIDELVAALVLAGATPNALCKACFTPRTRELLVERYPALLSTAGHLTRYAIVDAHDDNSGVHRLQVRAVSRHAAEPLAYLVPVGEVDEPAASGEWWTTAALTIAPAAELVGPDAEV